MHISIECYPCLLNQVLSTTQLCELDHRQKKEVMEFALKTMAQLPESTYPQEVMVTVNDHLKSTLGIAADVFDPYRELKEKSRKIALSFYDSIQCRIAESPHPLEFAIRCAVLGNIIDFGVKKHGILDVAEELRKIDELEFAIYDFDLFRQRLEDAFLILYIGDNVGEDVFDKALISQIRVRYPDKEIVFAVREQPVINDVTQEDAQAIGMERVARVISSGSIYPGTILKNTTKQFQEMFQTADLIIAKGQGNFETLYGEDQDNLFFLLRAKCEKVADCLDIELGSMVLKKNTPTE